MPDSDETTNKLSAEALSGLLLLASAVLALVAANSPWSKLYDGLLEVPATVAMATAMAANSAPRDISRR